MKKAVFIAYNQALTERVDYILKQLNIKGFTQWPVVNGAGTFGGEPRMGTHTWPEMNSATLTVVEEEMVPLLLKYVQKLDEVNKENGIRAFVWDITSLYWNRFSNGVYFVVKRATTQSRTQVRSFVLPFPRLVSIRYKSDFIPQSKTDLTSARYNALLSKSQ